MAHKASPQKPFMRAGHIVTGSKWILQPSKQGVYGTFKGAGVQGRVGS